RLPGWNPWVYLDEVIVMPNHVHGIVAIGTDGDPPAAPRPTLGAVIGRFKALSAGAINRERGTPGAAVWQRGYYERIVRDDRAWDAIRDYIHDNPAMWDRDPENPRARLSR
ncbi:MAG TPA: transposase, partial [Planctomycetota bacterium]|nr:transposase [Planctomycetota bacterium]